MPEPNYEKCVGGTQEVDYWMVAYLIYWMLMRSFR